MLLREEVSCPSGEFLAVKLIGGELASAAALAPRVRHFSNRVRVDRGFPQSGELFFNRSAPCLQWCFWVSVRSRGGTVKVSTSSRGLAVTLCMVSAGLVLPLSIPVVALISATSFCKLSQACVSCLKAWGMGTRLFRYRDIPDDRCA